MNAQVIQKKDSEGLNSQASNRVADPVYRKRMIQSYQEEIETLKRQKDKEKSEGLSQGRKKWFNRCIKQLRERIRDLENRGVST